MHRAASHGYDMVELDMNRFKDDDPVLFHDAAGSLMRNRGIPARLVDLTAQELTTIRYRASKQPIAALAQGLALIATTAPSSESRRDRPRRSVRGSRCAGRCLFRLEIPPCDDAPAPLRQGQPGG
jgi:glycerophosphoryl diester phosphodiesterase